MAPPGPPPDSTMNTPLAPSVEKAYYRKCIQLKRRLNEVEAANDEARTRRLRLDRAIMKMRLERAFLLDELRKRMEYNIDASEGSGDEGAQTPPPDRPYRDKRRRRPSPGQAPPANTFQQGTFAFAATPGSAAPGTGVQIVQGPGGQLVAANAVHDDNHYGYSESIAQRTAAPPAPLPHGSPYTQAGPPTGVPSSATPRHMNGHDGEHDREERPADRDAGAIGEPAGAAEEDGEKKIVPSQTDQANSEREQQDGNRAAFTAVNL